MAVEFDTFVNEMAAEGKHFLFVVEGNEWHYVLGKLGEEFFPDETSDLRDFGVITPRDGGSSVVWALRAKLPIEVVICRFGLTREQALGAPRIRLCKFPEPPKRPTVDYYGEA